MKALAEYDRLLSDQGSSELWDEDLVFLAGPLVTRFTEDDWRELVALMDERGVEWKARCADTMGDADFDHALAILTRILEVPDVDVQFVACDVLRLHLRNRPILKLPQTLCDQITSLERGFRDPLMKQSLHDLLQRIEPSHS